MVRIAAVGDVHLGTRGGGSLRPLLANLAAEAELLLLAGDLTQHGSAAEGRVAAAEFTGLGLPVVAVLGNHDHHSDSAEVVADALRERGITVLEGDGVVVPTAAGLVGVAGVKGFGGGFDGTRGHAFGERAMKDFLGATAASADALRVALGDLHAEVTVALTHYAPVAGTCEGEPRELYPYLGSSLLGEAIDAGRADLAVHGHAHYGREHGATAGGIPVRNVAQPVIGAPYRVLEVDVTAARSRPGAPR